jgi:hypothetical protein
VRDNKRDRKKKKKKHKRKKSRDRFPLLFGLHTRLGRETINEIERKKKKIKKIKNKKKPRPVSFVVWSTYPLWVRDNKPDRKKEKKKKK